MSSSWGHDPAQKTTTRRWQGIIAVILLILLIQLLVFAPGVLALLSVPAFFLALFALIIGRLRWARIPNRRVAGALLGGIFVLLLVSTGIAGSRLPATTADRDPVATNPSQTTTVAASPVTLVGETCDTADLVETEGTEDIYCHNDGAGSLHWVSAAAHEDAERQAAADKAAAEMKAAEKATAEKAAAAKEKAAAEKKAAVEKKAAETKAAEKASAEKKAAEKAAAAERSAAAKREAAEQAAAEEAAAAQRAAEQAARPKYQAPAPAPAPAPLPQSGGTDPQFSTCAKAIAAGYGPYVSGVNPEYNWYRDSDSDGINCES